MHIIAGLGCIITLGLILFFPFYISYFIHLTYTFNITTYKSWHISKKQPCIENLTTSFPETVTTSNTAASDDSDPFGEFLGPPTTQTTPSIASSSTPAPTDSVKTEEENFFNQKLPESGSGQDKLTKDSILALYGQTPAQPQPAPGMFGMPGGVYIAPTGAPTPMPTQPLGQPPPGMQNGGVVPQPQQQNMMFMAQVSE